MKYVFLNIAAAIDWPNHVSVGVDIYGEKIVYNASTDTYDKAVRHSNGMPIFLTKSTYWDSHGLTSDQINLLKQARK